MKKRFFGILILATAIISLILIDLMLVDSGPRQQKFPSPNGEMVALVVENRMEDHPNPGCLTLTVFDADQNPRFTYPTCASSFIGWQFQWIGDTALVLDSSDVGSIRWELDESGDWFQRAGCGKEMEDQ